MAVNIIAYHLKIKYIVISVSKVKLTGGMDKEQQLQRKQFFLFEVIGDAFEECFHEVHLDCFILQL